MVNGLRDIGKAFYDCLVTMTYESLSKVQKKVYDQVMKIVPHITSTDILVRCLFHSQSMRIPKNTEADVIKVLGTEKINLPKGTVTGILECHEQHRTITDNGNVRVITKNVTYIRYKTCDISLRDRPNFLAHKCSKRLQKSVVDLHCRKYCKKTFRSSWNRDLHENNCTGDHVCGECSETFRTEQMLVKHMKIHREYKSSIPQCLKCKCKFVSQLNLKRHQLKCDGPQQCKICNKEFLSKSNLERHFETCRKDVNCKICGNRFLTKESLEEHIARVHASQKKFPCSKCSDVFYSQMALLSHITECHKDLFLP